MQYIQENDETDQRPMFTDEGFTFAYIKVSKRKRHCTYLCSLAQQPISRLCDEAQLEYRTPSDVSLSSNDGGHCHPRIST